MRKTVTLPKTGGDDDIVMDLIAANAAAWARFGRACSLVDKDKAKEEGRKITAADEAEYEAANDAERETFAALLSFPTRQVVAVRSKTAWIELHINLGDALEHDQVRMLVGSMTGRTAA